MTNCRGWKVVEEDGKKVHVSCHNVESLEKNYQLKCSLVIVFDLFLFDELIFLIHCGT